MSTSYWSLRVTSFNFKLKNAWRELKKRLKIIIMGHRDSLSYLIVSCPDLKKPQWSRCGCWHMLGEYHPHTFLVANLINNWVSH